MAAPRELDRQGMNMASAATCKRAFRARASLLELALAGWPRRSAPLLEINCGGGEFLPLLWQNGFDVIGVEPDRASRLRAAARPVPGLEVFAGREHDLPFEDDTFDWAILHLRASGEEQMERAAGEALRVARRGMMLTFWNNASLAAFCWRLGRCGDLPVPAANWWLLWRIMRRRHAGKLTALGVLSGPVSSWRKRGCLAWLNRHLAWTPACAWCIFRMDLGASLPVTPLSLRLGAQLRPPRPAMEYVQKLSPTSKECHSHESGNPPQIV